MATAADTGVVAAAAAGVEAAGTPGRAVATPGSGRQGAWSCWDAGARAPGTRRHALGWARLAYPCAYRSPAAL